LVLRERWHPTAIRRLDECKQTQLALTFSKAKSDGTFSEEAFISPATVRHTDSELSKIAEQVHKGLSGNPLFVIVATEVQHALVRKPLHATD